MSLESFLVGLKIFLVPISIPVLLRYGIPFVKKINHFENKWRDVSSQVSRNSTRLEEVIKKVNWLYIQIKDLLTVNSNSSINLNEIQKNIDNLKITTAIVQYKLEVLEKWCQEELEYDPPTINKKIFR